MSGCKYNLKEFSPFTSGKKKIIPAVTDDWELVNKSYNTSSGIAMASKKLDCIIYDISFRAFVNFLREENVVMRGDRIEGRYAIGTRRVLRKEEDYLKTMATKEERTSDIIPKKDWIIGAKYETACGETFTYIGFRYVQEIQRTKSKGTHITNLKKQFYAVSSSNSLSIITSRRLIKKLPTSLKTLEECDNFLGEGHSVNWYSPCYLIFSKTKPKKGEPCVLTNIKPPRADYEPFITKVSEEFVVVAHGSWSSEVDGRVLKLEDSNNLYMSDKEVKVPLQRCSSSSIYSRDRYSPYSYYGVAL